MRNINNKMKKMKFIKVGKYATKVVENGQNYCSIFFYEI